MKKMLLLCMAMQFILMARAQHHLTVVVKNTEDQSPLPHATVAIKSLNQTRIADSTGVAIFEALAPGNYTVTVTSVGFREARKSILLKATNQKMVILLSHDTEHEHEEEIIVTATRMSRTIEDISTRVETISGEELDEKANMKPGEIRVLLSESTGIQTQQTSATSYNSSIRIQGLDGKYTQILRDGLPLYGGFSGGLSIMQIAPLDLKQAEVIKGSSSTLYGGGAIAGLVNLVSKTPGEKRQINVLANITSALGFDLSGFYSEKFEKIGVTFFGSRNTGRPYDPADIGLTAIPKFERYTAHPRVFFYGKKTNADVGLSYVTESRVGGSLSYIKHGTPGYFEKNNTTRLSTQFSLRHELTKRSAINFKNSISFFDRAITIPSYVFDGKQVASYSEINYSFHNDNLFWIAGANIVTDEFKEQPHVPFPKRNYRNHIYGLFLQNTWAPTNLFSLETGLRGDYVKQYGFELLPRVSAMFKFTPKFTARVGGGMGYKTPSVFNEDAERMQFRNILPINEQTVNNERSFGGNLDFNYRTRINEVGITFNTLFFYTNLREPLVAETNQQGVHEFKNAVGHIDTRGLEANLRLSYSDFKLFMGYTLADVETHFQNEKQWLPLTAKHRLNNVLMYEKDEKLKIGLEAYYFSPQKLNDGTLGKPYWICGALAEKLWETFSIFINFENIFDTRQTRFESIYTGTIDNPLFRDIYAPVDGFVVNGGIKIRL